MRPVTRPASSAATKTRKNASRKKKRAWPVMSKHVPDDARRWQPRCALVGIVDLSCRLRADDELAREAARQGRGSKSGAGRFYAGDQSLRSGARWFRKRSE